MAVNKSQQVPINIVGSSIFGRYPKISSEKTYNMFISDNWLVNYPGFKKKVELAPRGQGRGYFSSVRGNFTLSVQSSSVYRMNEAFSPVLIGNLDTNSGEVFIDENLSNQICIVDGDFAYIYNYEANTFTKQILTFAGNPIVPSYVCYHNTFFLIGSASFSDNSQNWYAFERATDSTIQINTQFSLQTKPDSAIAVQRLPGRGNNVLVLGNTVAEVWTQVGGLENYRRVQSFNIDSGIVSPSTIAASDDMMCWLAQNQNNAPFIMVTDGGSAKRLSTDGIDYVLSAIKHPEDSTAFFYRQDGHLFYQLTFYNDADNLTLVHDFTTGKFYHLADQNLNYHPARQIVYFAQDTYFVSINDASIYRMNTDLLTYDYSTSPLSVGEEIPRIRICKTVRQEDSSRFRVGRLTFWLEQGVNDYLSPNEDESILDGFVLTQDGGNVLTEDGGFVLTEDSFSFANANRPRVDFSFSKNGNQSFSNIVSKYLNIAGRYKNQLQWWRMGEANEFTPQFRFWGFQRFVAFDGIVEVY